MIAGEVGRFYVTKNRNVRAAGTLLSQLTNVFQELKQLPWGGPLLRNPYDVNFNADYFPGCVATQGPIWKNPYDVPISKILEDNYATIRGELDAILAMGDTFNNLDAQTRNAETQFGPNATDWLTVYLVRGGEFFGPSCEVAPKTCALLRTRPELTQCSMGGSGSGFLRMRPGGRLKPHFGNAPRLSAHLGLIIPDGEMTLNVGWDVTRWEEGKVMVFDDTFIHQVTANVHEPRYVLNIWMCHPCDAGNGGHTEGTPLPAYCDGQQGALRQLGLETQPRPPPEQR